MHDLVPVLNAMYQIFTGVVTSAASGLAHHPKHGAFSFVNPGVQGLRDGDAALFLRPNVRKNIPALLLMVVRPAFATLLWDNASYATLLDRHRNRHRIGATIRISNAATYARSMDGIWSILFLFSGASYSDRTIFWLLSIRYPKTQFNPVVSPHHGVSFIDIPDLSAGPLAGMTADARTRIEHALRRYNDSSGQHYFEPLGLAMLEEPGVYTFEVYALYPQTGRQSIVVTLPTMNGIESFEYSPSTDSSTMTSSCVAIRLSAECRRGAFYALNVSSGRYVASPLRDQKTVSYRIVKRLALESMDVDLICPTDIPAQSSSSDPRHIPNPYIPPPDRRGIWRYRNREWTFIPVAPSANGNHPPMNDEQRPMAWSNIWVHPDRTTWVLHGRMANPVPLRAHESATPGRMFLLEGVWGCIFVSQSGHLAISAEGGLDAPSFCISRDEGATWQAMRILVPPDAYRGVRIALFTLEFVENGNVFISFVYQSVNTTTPPNPNPLLHCPAIPMWQATSGPEAHRRKAFAYYYGPLTDVIQTQRLMSELYLPSFSALRPCYLGNGVAYLVTQQRFHDENGRRSVIRYALADLVANQMTIVRTMHMPYDGTDINGYPNAWIYDYGIATFGYAVRIGMSLHWGHQGFIEHHLVDPALRSPQSDNSVGRPVIVPTNADRNICVTRPAIVGNWSYYLTGLTRRNYPNQRSPELNRMVRQTSPILWHYDEHGYNYADPMIIRRYNYVTRETQTLSEFGAVDHFYDRGESTFEAPGFIYAGISSVSPGGRFIAFPGRDRYNRRRNNVTTVVRHDDLRVETVEGPDDPHAWLSSWRIVLDPVQE